MNKLHSTKDILLFLVPLRMILTGLSEEVLWQRQS